jgi:hypothetical protein
MARRVALFLACERIFYERITVIILAEIGCKCKGDGLFNIINRIEYDYHK